MQVFDQIDRRRGDVEKEAVERECRYSGNQRLAPPRPLEPRKVDTVLVKGRNETPSTLPGQDHHRERRAAEAVVHLDAVEPVPSARCRGAEQTRTVHTGSGNTIRVFARYRYGLSIDEPRVRVIAWPAVDARSLRGCYPPLAAR